MYEKTSVKNGMTGNWICVLVRVQKFVAQPAWSLRTDEGLLNGYLTLSCFMLGERASAVYSRFSPEAIAGTEAYWVPIYVK